MPDLGIALPSTSTANHSQPRRVLSQRPLLTIGLGLVLLIVLLALLTPALPLRDPNITTPARRLSGAGVNGYLLGSDQLGRDLLSRLLWGARVSIAVASIAAARALGASDRRIMLREVLPSIAPPLLVFVTLNVGALIVETAGLSFIGLGAQPPTDDWGTMLADGRQFMMTSPHVAAI